ncbi:MAG TPA: 3-ketoacyl-ACP reductase [Pseudorhodoferax sp.]|nr:3-ketoacyl-ACP reductase [Pseudorhodoferax sp.]
MPAACPARPLAIVTGARRGIGAAIAVALAARGHDLALTDIATDGAEEVLAAVAAVAVQGARARFFPFDLAEAEQHGARVQEIADWGGPVACLVNNAGLPAASRGDLLDVGMASFDRLMDVNLRGTFFFTQAVARHMLAAPCAAARSIVTVSSVSVEMASVERGEYCLSKAGLGMLTRLFALRLAEAGIAVFEVRPGIIRTPMTEGVASSYEARIAAGLVPQRRWGQPEDVARTVALLAGGELAFSTGSVVHVDGALSIPRL